MVECVTVIFCRQQTIGNAITLYQRCFRACLFLVFEGNAFRILKVNKTALLPIKKPYLQGLSKKDPAKEILQGHFYIGVVLLGDDRKHKERFAVYLEVYMELKNSGLGIRMRLVVFIRQFFMGVSPKHSRYYIHTP